MRLRVYRNERGEIERACLELTKSQALQLARDAIGHAEYSWTDDILRGGLTLEIVTHEDDGGGMERVPFSIHARK